MPSAKKKPTNRKRKPSQKPTNAELKRRVKAVYKLLLQGKPRADILEHAVETWGVAVSTTDTYIASATKIFNERVETEQEIAFGVALARLHDLFNRSMGLQDVKAALAVQKELNTLLDLYGVQRIELSGNLTQTNVNIEAESGHDAGNILADLAELGAIPPQPSADDNDPDTE